MGNSWNNVFFYGAPVGTVAEVDAILEETVGESGYTCEDLCEEFDNFNQVEITVQQYGDFAWGNPESVEVFIEIAETHQSDNKIKVAPVNPEWDKKLSEFAAKYGLTLKEEPSYRTESWYG